MRTKLLNTVGSGLGWGLGMGIALGITTVAGGGARPMAKAAVKGGLWAKDRLTVLIAEGRERAEDIYYEARAERDAEQALLDGTAVSVVAANGEVADRPTSKHRA
ncbi:MAG: hypothetical protein JOZ46_12535 [Candidatus Dormibacteraeota bacterium]|nr:hypothetical protein [Candidatus Dormibacteraeota bacterium]MBV9526628.1 hypothetical protein [Candidatus Dormibacteraeota bacterium]